MKLLFPHIAPASRLRSVMMIGLAATVITAITGCSHYRVGFLAHPQIKTVAIGSFENHTDEPALSVLLRKKLAEQFTTNSSLRLADEDSADILVRGNINSYDTSRSAAAKLRDEDDVPGDRTTYQTTIYNVKVNVDFETVIPSQGYRRVISRRSVAGEGDFSEMPDLNMARQVGLQQALYDAASQVVTAVTEAW